MIRFLHTDRLKSILTDEGIHIQKALPGWKCCFAIFIFEWIVNELCTAFAVHILRVSLKPRSVNFTTFAFFVKKFKNADRCVLYMFAMFGTLGWP